MNEIQKSFTTEKYVVSYPVTSEHDNLRLDQFIMTQMPNLSRQFLKKKIEKGEITISVRTPPHKSSVKVHAGEKVTVVTHNDGMLEDEYWFDKVVPRDQEPTILFEDPGLLVSNKPPFMLTHPAGKNLFYCATVFFEAIYKQTMHSIHRLDRETSGILMLGKTPRVAQKVSLLFAEDKVRKCYFLIGRKNLNAQPFPFVARQRLGADDNAVPRGLISAYDEHSELGKDAETRFELVFEKDGYVLALAFPLSGRQHQIRVHAAVNGYPLLGDKLYNGDSSIFIRFKDFTATKEDHEKMQIPRQALHAVALEMAYPENKESRFIAPLPEDLKSWLKEKLEIDPDQVQQEITKMLSKWTL
jgi:23S rRNA pseudouridine1911/1915/1917 synthase